MRSPAGSPAIRKTPRRLGVLSQGLYGAKRAVPKLMELLAETKMPATFYIPGWVVDHHTDRCKEIRDAGFEIGHHGYSHEWADPKQPERECADFDRASEVLDRLLGVTPRGYRPPAAEITANTIKMLADRGYLYNTNMLDDVYPYRHELPDGRPGPVELPTHWSHRRRRLHAQLDPAPPRHPDQPGTSSRSGRTNSTSSTNGAACSIWSCIRRRSGGRRAWPCCAASWNTHASSKASGMRTGEQIADAFVAQEKNA